MRGTLCWLAAIKECGIMGVATIAMNASISASGTAGKRPLGRLRTYESRVGVDVYTTQFHRAPCILCIQNFGL